jgi:uncharacterized protein YvpB
MKSNPKYAPNAAEIAQVLDQEGASGVGYYFYHHNEQGAVIEFVVYPMDESQQAADGSVVQKAVVGYIQERGLKPATRSGWVVSDEESVTVALAKEDNPDEVDIICLQIKKTKDGQTVEMMDPGNGTSAVVTTLGQSEPGYLAQLKTEAKRLAKSVGDPLVLPVSAAGLDEVGATETPEATSTPVSSPTPVKTATAEPTQTPTQEPTETPPPEPTVIPTRTPEPTATKAPTKVPTKVPPKATVTPVANAGEAQANPNGEGAVEVPHVNQRYNECGPTAIYMALLKLGFKITIDDVVAAAKEIPPKEGGLDTTVKQNLVVFSSGAVFKMAEKLGFGAEGGDNKDINWIQEQLRAGRPVIVLVSDPTTKYFGHFVVIESISDKGVEIDDPLLKKDKIISRSEFDNIWNVILDIHDPLQPKGHAHFAVALFNQSQ